MPSRPFIILLFVIPILTGCMRNRHAERVMDHAEAIIEEHPDSALALMQDLDGIVLRSSGQNARRALLLSLAMYKNYIDVDDDSLIAVADGYYSTSDDVRRRMLASFCHGNLLYNAARYPEAITRALHAEADAATLRDTLWLARTNELLADIYSDNFMRDEAEYRILNKITYYKRASRPKNVLYSYLNLATAYYNNDKCTESIHILDSIKSIAQAYKDTILAYDITSASLLPLNQNRQHQKALEGFDSLRIFHPDYEIRCRDYIEAANAWHSLGNHAKSREYLDSAYRFQMSESEKMIALYLESELAYATGHSAQAIALKDSVLRTQSEVVHEILRRPIVTAEKEMYADLAHTSSQKAANARSAAAWILMSAVLIILLLVFIYRRRIKRKNIKIKTFMEEASALSDEVELLSKKLTTKEDSDNLNIIEPFYTISALCDRFYLYDDNDATTVKKHIVDNIHNEIMSLSDNGTREKIVKLANSRFSYIVSRLKNDITNIDNLDIEIFSHCVLGLSTKSISLITATPVKTIYTRKTRLIKKISESDSDNKSEYIGFIKTKRKSHIE